MAKNKTPAERAQYSYDTKKEYDKLYTPKDRAKDRYKVYKEYRKLEKRDKLPGFIITIIVFVLFIGVFTGLYTHYDYELDLKPKEFKEINVLDSSKVVSKQLKNGFITFFLTLDKASSLSDTAFDIVVSNDNLSDNPDVNVYLLSLKNQAYLDAEKSNLAFAFVEKQHVNYFIRAYSNPDAINLYKGYFIKGSFHKAYAHVELIVAKETCFPSWNLDEVHNKFVELEICHRYNGELYKYCKH